MKKLNLPVIVVLITFLLFQSCSQDDSAVPIKSSDDVTFTKDELTKNLAQRLAILVKNESVKQFLKKEVLKTFDGDYNVLAIEVLQKTFDVNGQTRSFGEHLLNVQSESELSFENLIKMIEKDYPLLQIKIPSIDNITPEEWDTQELTPLVAYVPSKITNDDIPAYDHAGNQILLSRNRTPDQLVIVWSENERVTVIEQTELEKKDFCSQKSAIPYYKYSAKNFFLKEKLSECEDFPITISFNTKSSNCERDEKNGKDKINRIKFNTKSDFNNAKDGWLDGKLELQLTILLGKANGQITEFSKNFYPKEKDMKHTKWYDVNVETVTWDKSIYGDAMLYTWIEEDPGNPLTISLDFASKILGKTISFSFSKTITNEDDKLGSSIIEYCDATSGYGHLYNTGTVQFQVNQNEYQLAYEDEYLVGDWDGDGRDNIAVRRHNQIIMDFNFDGISDFSFFYGLGDQDEYLVGDWNGDGRDNIAVRRSNHIIMDYNFDGIADSSFFYGLGNAEDEYLVGDWDGDGRDNIAIRRSNGITMDYNFDGTADFTYFFGNGVGEDQYLVGDRNGDGKDNIGIRKNQYITMDNFYSNTIDYYQTFGNGSSEDEYLIGDWNGDGKDNLAVRRGNEILMDYNFDTTPDFTYQFGLGTN